MTATPEPRDRPPTAAVVLRPHGAREDRADAAARLEEAVSLTTALDGVEVLDAQVVPAPKVTPATLFGSGKVEELAESLKAAEADLAVIDAALTPVQQRNLERAWSLKVVDRTGLILEIFGQRAETREGVLQVELAHLSYQKSRLVRSWTHLERQRGGVGFMGGPGETQIEADRRALDAKIARLRRQLDKVVRTRALHRTKRQKVPEPVVALVGYTNAGKSTLFNRLTEAEVLAKDMLFATLDPTMRRVTLPSGRPAIFSDTVGFVSDLPTQLVAAFRATLEEVLEADLIVFVSNAAHAEEDRQRADVLSVLRELGVPDERIEGMIEVRNKIDLLDEVSLQRVRNAAERRPDMLAISAVTGAGLDALLPLIEARLYPRRVSVEIGVDHAEGRAQAWLHARGEVRAQRADDAEIVLTVEMTEKELAQFAKAFGDAARIGAPRELAAE